jgi:predicted CXXCH cytochrome family protein
MRALVFTGVVLAVGAAWLLLLPPAPLAQPLAFNHARHKGVTCTVCHRGAETAARASIPQGDLCLKCHATAPLPQAQGLWDAATKGARLPWTRVTHVPDHVYFSHRRHVGLARLECLSCHADIGARTAPPGRAPLRLDMDSCLACHRSEGATLDCAACHR